MKPLLAVSAIGKDRPGIVAGLTRVLFEHGGNLEDSSMTRLKGDFAVLLLVALPERADAAEAVRALKEEAHALGLTLLAREVKPGELGEASARTARPYTLVLYGADKPGLVHRVAEAAAEKGLNITDLRSQLTGAPGKPVYSLALELDAPDEGSARAFAAVLEGFKTELQVDLTFSAVEADDL